MDTFYVTPAERRMLSALPKALTEKWANRLQDESLMSYETSDEILERLKSVSYDNFPAAKSLAQKVAKTIEEKGDFSSLSFKDFPAEAIPTLLHSIGASGIEAFIEISLRDPSLLSDSALESVAALSRARHHILKENASAHA